MKIRVLSNPISGYQRRLQGEREKLKAILADYDLEAEVIQLKGRGQATALAREAVGQDFDMVVVVGGDGTINEAVCGLVKSDVPLGIVPAGSGNAISREFGIPTSLIEACRIIANGRSRRVDVGCLNGRFFLGTAGFGYDALVSKLFEKHWGGQRGMWSYFVSAAWGYFQYQPQAVQLRTADRVVTVRPLFVVAANTTQFGGGAIIAPGAKPDDGLLDVCIIRHLNLLQALYYWPRLFWGRIDTVPQWDMIRSPSLDVFSDQPIPLQADGEPIAPSKHVQVRILPGSLLLRVP